MKLPLPGGHSVVVPFAKSRFHKLILRCEAFRGTFRFRIQGFCRHSDSLWWSGDMPPGFDKMLNSTKSAIQTPSWLQFQYVRGRQCTTWFSDVNFWKPESAGRKTFKLWSVLRFQNNSTFYGDDNGIKISFQFWFMWTPNAASNCQISQKILFSVALKQSPFLILLAYENFLFVIRETQLSNKKIHLCVM